MNTQTVQETRLPPPAVTLRRAATLRFAGIAEDIAAEGVTKTGGRGCTLYWVIQHGRHSLTVAAQRVDLPSGDGYASAWRMGVEPVSPGDDIGPALEAWSPQLGGNVHGATLSLRVLAGTSVQFIVG